jgi:hypothetical protein
MSAKYVLVPVEPTDEILSIIKDINSDSGEGWKRSDAVGYWHMLISALTAEPAHDTEKLQRKLDYMKSERDHYRNLVNKLQSVGGKS